MQIETILQAALTANGYEFSAMIQQQLQSYLALLSRWNRVYNLTAIREPRDMVYLHILDSLSIGPYLHGSQIIDVGTGAGLPGIPLALTHTDKSFVLLDSNSKKTRFLNQVIYELKIKNVEVVHARCEDFQPAIKFDSILSRAFASLAVMLTATAHLGQQDAQFLAMKGTYPEQELAEMPKGFKLLAIDKLTIKGLNAERHLVRLSQ
jgi:16S rRNA (guanine527-N7)-methyltransferase